MMLFYVLIFIISILFIVHNLVYNNAKARAINELPLLPGYPVIGNAADVLYSPVSLFYRIRWARNNYNGFFAVWIFNMPIVNISKPNDIEVILSSTKHITKSVIYDFLHPWLNSGLLTSTGAKWQQRRKILTPAFHFNILKLFCKIFIEQSDLLVEKLKKVDGKEVEILPYITEFTLNTICETAMGTNFNSVDKRVENYKKSIYEIGELIINRFCRFWLHPSLFYNMTMRSRRQEEALNTLHKFTTDVIKDRRDARVLQGNKFVAEDFTEENTKYLKKRLAMLDLLLSVESEGSIDEKGIREEVDTFMFEGHDTTTAAISFCLMLLANNPEAQNMVWDEIKEVLGDSNSQITIEHLNKMRYLERCIKEALRLYPSVHLIGRILKEDLKLREYMIPSGTTFFISIYDLHRDYEIFPNPDKFDPDRFLPEVASKRHPYAYLPFSAGPRNCIGQKFAIYEEKAVIATILKDFKLEPVTRPDDIIFKVDLVLRPSNTIKIKFIPRMS